MSFKFGALKKILRVFFFSESKCTFLLNEMINFNSSWPHCTSAKPKIQSRHKNVTEVTFNLKWPGVQEKQPFWISKFYRLSNSEFRTFFTFVFIFFTCILYLLYVFPLPCSLILRPCNHRTVVHTHESFFLFARSFHPLTFPTLAVILLSTSFIMMFSGPSILSQRVKFSSFLLLRSIPLCKCPIVVLSTRLLMDTWAASISWQF